MTARQSDARIKQIAFWKKHQSILQNCADLSQMCGVRILCVMTLPDKVANGVQQEFRWDDNDGSDTQNIHTHFIQGTTIVFDSFSNEDDVQRRNQAAINISKINDVSRRFATDFIVRASGEITAILSASTVTNYRVVDSKRMPRLPPPPAASFSSIISNGVMAQSDKELVSSLAACASPPTPTSSLAALSSVASHRLDRMTDTDQLRKRCRTMIQQRCVHNYRSDDGTSCCLVTQTMPAIPLLSDQSINPIESTATPNQQNVNTIPFSSPHVVTCTHSTAMRNSPRPFFAPIIRPIAVQQALSQTFRGEYTEGLKLPDCYSHDIPVESTNQPSFTDYHGMGDKPASPTTTFTIPPGTTDSSPLLSLSQLPPTTNAALTTSAFTSYTNSRPVIFLPPLTFPPALFGDSQLRLSSSDLIFTSMAPIPLDGSMNLSDIRFHRSSDDIITLAAAW